MVKKLRAKFIRVPSWVPVLGTDAITSLESAISGFSSLRKQLNQCIIKAVSEKSQSIRAVADLRNAIDNEEKKQVALAASIFRADTIINNIGTFLGETPVQTNGAEIDPVVNDQPPVDSETDK